MNRFAESMGHPAEESLDQRLERARQLLQGMQEKLEGSAADERERTPDHPYRVVLEVFAEALDWTQVFWSNKIWFCDFFFKSLKILNSNIFNGFLYEKSSFNFFNILNIHPYNSSLSSNILFNYLSPPTRKRPKIKD